MADITTPQPLRAPFAKELCKTKADFTNGDQTPTTIQQFGAATLPLAGWPGWPAGLSHAELVIETYVADETEVQATSENEPFVSAWMPLVHWMNTTVRSTLGVHGVELDGAAFVTASLTPVALLEGMAHMDDDTFMPDQSVGVVAIIGEHDGPRIATGTLSPEPLRPMSQVIWTEGQRTAFEGNHLDHCACDADQLVIFPQFGQLHAGPAASHLVDVGPDATRQLLVYRARVIASPTV